MGAASPSVVIFRENGLYSLAPIPRPLKLLSLDRSCFFSLIRNENELLMLAYLIVFDKC